MARRGLEFLVKTQKDDGSWHVASRSRPIQRYFEMRNADTKCQQSRDAARVFLNKHGEALSTRSVRRKLDKYLVSAGLDPGISPHTLTSRLCRFEAFGVVSRAVYPEAPPRVEYRLTPFGETPRPVLDAMAGWGVTISEPDRDVATI